jgi:hypothetical protein
MKPHIEKTSFGSITIDGETITHDLLITLNGDIRKRKKKLSKKYYGTSHVLSLDEAQYIYEEGVEKIIFGTGQFGRCSLSDEAEMFFERVGCEVQLLPTPEAIQVWNDSQGRLIGLFHLTC